MNYYKYYFRSEELPGSAERIRTKNRLIYSLLESHVRAGAAVLELGVGKGWFARECIEHGHPFTGIESNEEACAVLSDSGLDVMCASVPPIPAAAPEGGFGLVYSAHLLEHLSGSQEVHELLGDCSRLAGSQGTVAALFPDAMSMGKHFWNCDYTHSFPTTARRVAQAMRDAGLEVTAVHHMCGHYTGGKRLLARVASNPATMTAVTALCRGDETRDRLYRGWLYLQQDILMIARPAS